jgi:hypothetical protein
MRVTEHPSPLGSRLFVDIPMALECVPREQIKEVAYFLGSDPPFVPKPATASIGAPGAFVWLAPGIVENCVAAGTQETSCLKEAPSAFAPIHNREIIIKAEASWQLDITIEVHSSI